MLVFTDAQEERETCPRKFQYLNVDDMFILQPEHENVYYTAVFKQFQTDTICR